MFPIHPPFYSSASGLISNSLNAKKNFLEIRTSCQLDIDILLKSNKTLRYSTRTLSIFVSSLSGERPLSVRLIFLEENVSKNKHFIIMWHSWICERNDVFNSATKKGSNNGERRRKNNNNFKPNSIRFQCLFYIKCKKIEKHIKIITLV